MKPATNGSDTLLSVTSSAGEMTMRGLFLAAVDQPARGGLRQQADDAGDGHDQPDRRFVPAMRRSAHREQIDGEVGTEPVANIGQEEVQRVQRAAGGGGSPGGGPVRQ